MIDTAAFISSTAATIGKNISPSAIASILGASKTIFDYLTLNFSDYLESTAKRCSLVKTLVSRDTSINLYDIYTDTSFSSENTSASDEGVLNVIKSNQNSIIIGSAGCGKSMFMRHLFMSLISNTDGKIPIFIEIRNINAIQTKDLISFIQHSCVSPKGNISIDNFKRGLKDGLFIVVIDGFDEIDHINRNDVERQIVQMSALYPETTIIVSSRPDDRFTSWADFTTFHVQPMNSVQVISLMSKIPYDIAIKSKFISEIKNGLYRKHQSFLSNPLLATMMLITYDQTGNIPDKMHIFYEQAFETLYFRHDTSKQAAFRRKMHSDIPINNFKNALSSLCISTYLKERFQFSESELLDFVTLSFEHENINCNPSSFISDLLESVCIMQKDGLYIIFTHRSFQEYFSAFFISRVPSAGLTNILDRCLRRPNDNVINMVFDMNRDLIEREWILPNLRKFIDDIKYSGNVKSPSYLSKKLFGDLTMDNTGEEIGLFLMGGTDRDRFFTCLQRVYSVEFTEMHKKRRSNNKRDLDAYNRLVELQTIAPETKSVNIKPRRRKVSMVKIRSEDDAILKEISFFKYVLRLPAFLQEIEKIISSRVDGRLSVGVRLID